VSEGLFQLTTNPGSLSMAVLDHDWAQISKNADVAQGSYERQFI
jgi:hypothetical protein